MKPAAFKYIEVADEEALAAHLSDYGSDARILAGGQSLVPMMNFRIAAPELLLDINRVGSLAYIDCGDTKLRIGALTRHAEIENSAEIARHCPLLSLAVRHVAHRAVRNRGTLGGSLALAYPGAEMPLALATLDADIRVTSKSGERVITAANFICGALDTDLADGEYIRAVDIACPPKDSCASFVETSRRHGDFAIAAAAVIARRDVDGRLDYLRAGVSGGTGAPLRLSRLESRLLEGPHDVDGAIREAIADIDVFGDHHYPEDYRRHVLRAMLRRALDEAVAGLEAPHVH